MAKITAKYDTHLLREHYGITFTVSDDLRRKIGKAVLCVAGADGELSQVEWNYFLGLARSTGASDAMVQEFKDFDYQSADVKKFLDKETKPLARIILYDALRVARADGVQGLERDSAIKMAKAMGVDPAVIPAIEGLLGVEDALNAARIRVLSPVE